jgi:hypothetical protein
MNRYEVLAVHLHREINAEACPQQVKLYAEYASEHLIEFLRASNYYSLESVGFTSILGY